jgi:arylsulfatase A
MNMKHMPKILFLIVACVFCVAAYGADRPPNIVFILADDLGWADLGCYGNKFNESPAIDGLAREGLRFADFYAAGAVCSPTRASIMAGQYQARVGITAHIPGHWRPFEKLAEPPVALGLPFDIVSLAEALKEAGYATGHFGKWHLNWGTDGGGPTDHGFDEAHEISGHDVAPKRQVPPGKKSVRLTEYLAGKTIDFMRRHKDGPFFVEMNHYAVHIPLTTTPELLAKYEKKTKAPEYPCNPYYAGLIEELDRSVGKVLKAIDDLGLAENTLVVFTSDNGGLSKRFDGAGDVATSNAPLRDEKGSLYEGGIRVPLIVRWPGNTKPGTTTGQVAISTDFYRTFVELADGSLPSGQANDGANLLPVFRNPKADVDRGPIYFHYPHYHHSRPAGAIRMGRWKGIEFFDTNEFELYDLQADLGESRNVAAVEDDVVDRLRNRLRLWRADVNAQMPRRNPAYDPERAGEWWNRRTVVSKDAAVTQNKNREK